MNTMFLLLRMLVYSSIIQPIVSSLIDDLLGNRSKRPPIERYKKPLDVKLGMYLESLGNFRSTEMSFDVDLYVYLSWRDPRLAHNHPDYVVINDDEIRKLIWVPDLYFANARQAHFQEVTVPNFNMFIAKDGTVAYSLRCTLTVACSLDLRFYPMDAQVCSIRVLSYAYIANQINVTWFETNPIRHNPEIGLPEFHIKEVSKAYCNGTYRYALMPNSYKLDDFSCLMGQLFLARSIGYNLVQSYIPTGLIVMISWVSFWIDRRAVPARVTLSFTTLVSLTTLGNGLRFGLPQVSYAKAIDLWYGVCLLFVFCALLEFAIINSYMRKSEKFDQLARRHQNKEDTPQKKPVEVPPLFQDRNGAVLKKRVLVQKRSAPETYRYIDESTHRMDITELMKRGAKLQSPKRQNKIQGMKNEFNMVAFDNTACNNAELGDSLDSATRSVYDNLSSSENHVKESLLDKHFDNSDHEMYSLTETKLGLNGAMPEHHTDVSNFTKESKSFSRRALQIDQICRYSFPLTFLAWNTWYWWYYLVYNSPAWS